MVTIFWNNEELGVFEETFTSIKEAKNFIESLADDGIHNTKCFVHTSKYDWAAHYGYEVHWTTVEGAEFTICFEKKRVAKAFFNQMLLIYQDDWHSVYLFEHLGQGLLKQLSSAVKV